MKNNILKCIERLVELENDFDFTEIETAFYLYARYGENFAKNLQEEDVQEIYNHLQDYNGSLFNEDINEYMNMNFE